MDRVIKDQDLILLSTMELSFTFEAITLQLLNWIDLKNKQKYSHKQPMLLLAEVQQVHWQFLCGQITSKKMLKKEKYGLIQTVEFF